MFLVFFFLVHFLPLSSAVLPCVSMPRPQTPIRSKEISPCHPLQPSVLLSSGLLFTLLSLSLSLSSKLCINAGPETEKTQHSDLQMASGFITRPFPPTPPPSSSSEHPRCPRCNSQETKFCYYNNYNLAQPRHFCKSCRRYWTLGGTIRNIPVGGTSRRSYLAASASSTSSYSSSGISKRRRSDRPMSNSSSTTSSSATASSSSTMVLVDVHHHGGVHPPPQPISLVAPSNDEHFVPRTFGGLLTEPIPSGFRLGFGIEETGFSQGRSPWALFGEETYFNHVGVGVSIGRQPPAPAPSQQQQHQMVGGGIGDYGSDLFFDAWPISGGYGGGHFTWPDGTVDTTPVKRI